MSRGGRRRRNPPAMRRAKLLLMARDPHCHWCRRPVRDTRFASGKLAPDAATVDHWWPTPYRNQFPRAPVTLTPGEPGYVVLACYACNLRRGCEHPERWAERVSVEAQRAAHERARRSFRAKRELIAARQEARDAG